MQTVIIKDRDIRGGEPVFRGTRVPFKTLDHATNRAFGFFLAITSSFSAA
jgi:hypothetical protein